MCIGFVLLNACRFSKKHPEFLSFFEIFAVFIRMKQIACFCIFFRVSYANITGH